jgi:hypothetical protein
LLASISHSSRPEGAAILESSKRLNVYVVNPRGNSTGLDRTFRTELEKVARSMGDSVSLNAKTWHISFKNEPIVDLRNESERVSSPDERNPKPRFHAVVHNQTGSTFLWAFARDISDVFHVSLQNADHGINSAHSLGVMYNSTLEDRVDARMSLHADERDKEARQKQKHMQYITPEYHDSGRGYIEDLVRGGNFTEARARFAETNGGSFDQEYHID